MQDRPGLYHKNSLITTIKNCTNNAGGLICDTINKEPGRSIIGKNNPKSNLFIVSRLHLAQILSNSLWALKIIFTTIWKDHICTSMNQRKVGSLFVQVVGQLNSQLNWRFIIVKIKWLKRYKSVFDVTNNLDEEI